MPIDVSKIGESEFPSVDKKAKKEEDFYLNGINRKNRMEGTIHWCRIILLWICVICVGGSILFRVVYLFLPEHWRWLTNEQVGKIDEFFIHGTIGAIVVGYLRNVIKEVEE